MPAVGGDETVRVLMVTPEASPFAQTGGLGEVLAALPRELARLGVEVDVVMPLYRRVREGAHPLTHAGFSVELYLNAKKVIAPVWVLESGDRLRYLFLACDDYYDREFLYGTPESDYEDNSERFVFLARAAIEMAIKGDLRYDVFHSHDWQTALIPVYLRTLYAGEKLLETAATALTIHNLGYQGIFWHYDMPLVGVGWDLFTPNYMEFYGKLNFLKSGIVFADKVNTVSPGYRNEILTPEFGFGLEGVLQQKGQHLTGILNGVDYQTWNPALDSYIAAQYSPEDIGPKVRCKEDLQRICGLPVRPSVPLIAMVTRLSSQKGIDLVEHVLKSRLNDDIQFVLLGSGETRFQEAFEKIREEFPHKTGIFISFDIELAHKIFAGSDILLVPSRYEPCGLNQLYGLKYGAVPVVRNTGGLTDTVEDYDPAHDSGTGFKFVEPDPAALDHAMARALNLYRDDRRAWQRLMVRAMEKDFSWKRSAQAYLKLYEEATSGRRGDSGRT